MLEPWESTLGTSEWDGSLGWSCLKEGRERASRHQWNQRNKETNTASMLPPAWIMVLLHFRDVLSLYVKILKHAIWRFLEGAQRLLPFFRRCIDETILCRWEHGRWVKSSTQPKTKWMDRGGIGPQNLLVVLCLSMTGKFWRVVMSLTRCRHVSSCFD